MSPIHKFACASLVLTAQLTSAAPPGQTKSTPEPLRAYVDSLRDDLRAGKVLTYTRVMKLTSDESKVFWPIYQEYEEELFANGDKRLALIKEYVTLHLSRSLTPDKAKSLSAAWFDFQTQQLDLLRKYHAVLQEQLSPLRAAQFVQIEHRFSLVVDLTIASELPLVEPDAKASADGPTRTTAAVK